MVVLAESSCHGATSELEDAATYDVLITDILDDNYPDIERQLECPPRLTPVLVDGPFPVRGVLYGRNMRLVVSLTVFRSRQRAEDEKGVTVIFVIDTGSPATYVRAGTLRALGLDPAAQSMRAALRLRVQGLSLPVSVSSNHFSNVDLLGQDFFRLVGGNVTINYSAMTFKVER